MAAGSGSRPRVSWQLRLLGALLRRTVRARLKHATDPRPLRRHLELAAWFNFRSVPHMHALPTRFESPAGERQALWVGAGAVHEDRVVFYLHGGGYIAGSPQTHMKMVARLARMAGMRAFVPSYRLAPEHPAPAALQDARAAFEHLLAKGYRADQIIIGGDSAGGGLALALLAQLCQAGLRPQAVFALAPFCDLTFSGASVQDNAQRDHLFPGDRGPFLANLVLGALSPLDPRISPLFGDFPQCPPVLLQVSESEILRDDSRRMAQALRAVGADVTVQEWPEAPHVWQIFDGWLPEARQALRHVAEFIVRQR